MIAECDKKIVTPITLGLIALACWMSCPLVVLVGFPSGVVPVLVSWAAACSLFSLITSLLCLGKAKIRLVVAALALNGLPLLAVAGSVVWFLSHVDF